MIKIQKNSYNNTIKKGDNRAVKENKDWEVRQNLLEFFSLLIKVDKRVNPHLYKNKFNNYGYNTRTVRIKKFK
jgi:hypothetical protein